MKTYTLITLLFFALAFSSGCFAPVNSIYDNARLLEKGDVEVMSSLSSYYDIVAVDKNVNKNLGLALGYGVNDKLNLKMRYELLVAEREITQNGEWRKIVRAAHFFEVTPKFNVLKDKVAFALPLGVYASRGDISSISLEPRILATHRFNELVEVSIIPKLRISVRSSFSFTPGLTAGLGLSTNLDKWALRPEVGYDGTFYFGMSSNFYLSPFSKRKADPELDD